MPKETIIIRNEDLRKAALFTIGALDLEKPWELTIERHVKKRTNAQLALMFAWIDKVVEMVHEDTATDKATIHKFFKEMYLDPIRTEFAGKVFLEYTTKGLPIQIMAAYMNKIYAWCAAEGYILPVPEDLGRDKAA